MKYISEYRDGELARQISGHISREARPDRVYSFMEFCGGHTHTISRYGLSDLLPASVKMIHGPGCPVCVLPVGRIDQAISLALQHNAIVATYADTMRVPASGGLSMMKAKALGVFRSSARASRKAAGGAAGAAWAGRECNPAANHAAAANRVLRFMRVMWRGGRRIAK